VHPQRTFLDLEAIPDLAQEFSIAYDSPCVAGEHDQNVEGAAADRDGHPFPQKLSLGNREFERAE
jgi:hypothetical protein